MPAIIESQSIFLAALVAGPLHQGKERREGGPRVRKTLTLKSYQRQEDRSRRGEIQELKSQMNRSRLR